MIESLYYLVKEDLGLDPKATNGNIGRQRWT